MKIIYIKLILKLACDTFNVQSSEIWNFVMFDQLFIFVLGIVFQGL